MKACNALFCFTPTETQSIESIEFRHAVKETILVKIERFCLPITMLDVVMQLWHLNMDMEEISQ